MAGGRRRLAHIIGADDRVEEADYPGWPYTAVGQVLFSQGSCSGIMIGPRAVLTAGHCVYSRKRKVRPQMHGCIPTVPCSCLRHRPSPRALIRHAPPGLNPLQAWQDRITFTPYRHRSNGKDTWPVGRIAYTHATTYQ